MKTPAFDILKRIIVTKTYRKQTMAVKAKGGGSATATLKDELKAKLAAAAVAELDLVQRRIQNSVFLLS